MKFLNFNIKKHIGQKCLWTYGSGYSPKMRIVTISNITRTMFAVVPDGFATGMEEIWFVRKTGQQDGYGVPYAPWDTISKCEFITEYQADDFKRRLRESEDRLRLLFFINGELGKLQSNQLRKIEEIIIGINLG